MKTLQIENTREIFFTSKEQYLHLRKVWSKATNSADTRKTLTATHHLIYALIRGRDAMKGFTPVTNSNKLENGTYINQGLYEARYLLSRLAADVSRGDGIDNFLKPFEGTITPEMITKLNELCPTVQILESNYGKGSKLAKAIIASKTKPKSFAEMYELFDEVA